MKNRKNIGKRQSINDLWGNTKVSCAYNCSPRIGDRGKEKSFEAIMTQISKFNETINLQAQEFQESPNRIKQGK